MKFRDVVPIWRLEPLQWWWANLEAPGRLRRWWVNRRPLKITREMLQCNLEAARRHGVESACHPYDFIYRFVLGHPGFGGIQAAVDYYFDDGARSAKLLGEILDKLSIGEQPIRLLEFASGYGCVTRHLAKNPALSVVASDIHAQAIKFLSNKIGVETILSAHVPEDFSLEEKVDVVFALSFFSHMPKSTFGRWIKVLFSQLKRPGYLVFTTHGLASRKNYENPEIPADGFWFQPHSEQGDLSKAEYGSTIVTPEFVTREVREQTGEPILEHRHAFWWEHQDLWVVKKS